MEEDYEHQTSRVLFSWSSYSVWGEPISPRQNSCQRACQKSNQLSAHLKAPWLALILKVLSVQYREGKYIENARARALNKSYPMASLHTCYNFAGYMRVFDSLDDTQGRAYQSLRMGYSAQQLR